MKQRIIISQSLEEDLTAAVQDCQPDRLFILTDETTRRVCLPLVESFPCLSEARLITIGATDTEKTLENTAHVWQSLQEGGATRHSLLINLGGGMVTDLGGFAASTFKRGIEFINIPTTLLALVDASVGGKTGINFGGLKNEIGVFRESRYVLLSTEFLRTLDCENLRSGYAEMIKHGLINPDDGGEMWRELLGFDILNPDFKSLGRMVAESVAVKERVVEADPHERGLRKALNLGHTFGHAFEEWAMRHGRPVLHGYAVAYGLIPELYLSTVKKGFPADTMRVTVQFISDIYGSLPITCDDYPELLELMTHDKKNISGRINFTLLRGIGRLALDETATRAEIEEALDFMREGL